MTTSPAAPVATLPKVLKVGVVVADQLVKEVVFDHRQTVTIGSSPGASYTHAETGLPEDKFELFVWRDGAYHIRFVPGMKGGFTAKGEKVSVQKAVKQADAARDGEAFILPLVEDDKGKVELGAVTVLFRFVEAPTPVVVAPTKIPDFRPKLLGQGDPVFSGFLALFGALGVVFGVWVMNAERPEVTVEDFDQRIFTKIPTPENKAPVEADPSEKDPGEKPEEKAEQKPDEKPVDKPADKPPERSAEQMNRSNAEVAKARVISNSALFQAMIGTTGQNGRGQVLIAADGGIGNLSGDLSKLQAGGNFKGDGVIRTGATEIGGGNRSADGSLADSTKPGGNTELTVVKVAKPNVNLSDPDVEGPVSASGVKAVVKSNRGSLLFCHEAALRTNPKVAGKLEVEWRVESEGAVDVDVVVNTTDDKALESCVVQKIRKWKFVGIEDGVVKNTFVFQPKEE